MEGNEDEMKEEEDEDDDVGDEKNGVEAETEALVRRVSRPHPCDPRVYRLCDVCESLKPPRAHHCSTCGRFVRRSIAGPPVSQCVCALAQMPPSLFTHPVHESLRTNIAFSHRCILRMDHHCGADSPMKCILSFLCLCLQT